MFSLCLCDAHDDDSGVAALHVPHTQKTKLNLKEQIKMYIIFRKKNPMKNVNHSKRKKSEEKNKRQKIVFCIIF